MMEAVKRPSPRPAVVGAVVVVAVVGAVLLRGVTSAMSDDAVRHGVATRAVVLASDEQRATVRIPLPTSDVVTDIDVARRRSVGDTVPVVYDPVDPTRASEQGASRPSRPMTRGLVVAALLATGVAGGWLASRRPAQDGAPASARADVVRCGRALEPERSAR